MKNKKGFTLIELLAVIVILAIIALIATPIVLNMINNARKNAAKSAALGYIDSIEYYAGFSQLGSDTGISGYGVGLPTMTNGSVTCTKTSSGWDANSADFFEAVDAKTKGEKPDTAKIIISSIGKVTGGTEMTFGDYVVIYDGKDATVNKKSGSSSEESSSEPEPPLPSINFGGKKEAAKAATELTPADTHRGIVYLDPTDLEAECDETGFSSANGTKVGCMRFYVFDDTGNSYKMILDHNTSTSTVKWNSTGSSSEMKEVATQLSTDTADWQLGEGIDEVRLIGADEIAHIVGADRNDTLKWSKDKPSGATDVDTNSEWFYLDGGSNNNPTVYESGSDGWQKRVANSKGASKYAWLFSNLYQCEYYGCDQNSTGFYYGYWTQTPLASPEGRAWFISNDGRLNNVGAGAGNYNVRPVIVIRKAIID